MKKLFASTGLAATLLLTSIAGTTTASATEPVVTSTNQLQSESVEKINLDGVSQAEINAAFKSMAEEMEGVTYQLTEKGNEFHFNIDEVYNAYKNAPMDELGELGVADIVAEYEAFKSLFGDVFVMTIDYDEQKQVLDYFMNVDGKNEHFHTVPLNEDGVEISPPNYADENDYTDEGGADSLWIREAPNFKDISGHYAERQIIALYRMGVVNGTNEAMYNPNKQLTRAQFASMLMNTITDVESDVKDSPAFKDIDNHWAKEDIVQLYKLGVINGSSPVAFNPNKPITRQQAAAMMERYLVLTGTDTDKFSNTLPFNDNDKISEYARSGVSVLVNMGVVDGDPNGFFNPADTLTRGQMAKILYGVIEYMIVEEATAQK